MPACARAAESEGWGGPGPTEARRRLVRGSVHLEKAPCVLGPPQILPVTS